MRTKNSLQKNQGKIKMASKTKERSSLLAMSANSSLEQINLF